MGEPRELSQIGKPATHSSFAARQMIEAHREQHDPAYVSDDLLEAIIEGRNEQQPKTGNAGRSV